MKRFLCLVSLAITAALPARAEILLKGIAIVDGVPLFSLYSTEDQTGRWVRIGQNFNGWKTDRFDPTRATLTLVQGEHRLQLLVERPKIKEAVPEAATTEIPPQNFLRVAANGTISTVAGTFSLENPDALMASLDKDAPIHITLVSPARLSTAMEILGVLGLAGITRAMIDARATPVTSPEK
jgi:hypothetical protein